MIDNMIKKYDLNGDGKIDFIEYLKVSTEQKAEDYKINDESDATINEEKTKKFKLRNISELVKTQERKKRE